MRWLAGSLAALVVLVLTFPVLCSSSSDGPGSCTSAVGLRTLGTSESGDVWGVLVSVPSSALVFVLVVFGWKLGRGRR